MGNGMSKMHIFISHKHEDAAAAELIKAELLDLGPKGRLSVFISEEIAAGAEWYTEIQKHLVQSRVLLLLYTDDTQDWGWCLYEAGLFTDIRSGDRPDRRRVVCLTGTGVRPKPLEHLEAVDARNREEVAAFLDKIFRHSEDYGLDQPLVQPGVAASHWSSIIDETAGRICKAVLREPVESRPFGKHLFIEVGQPDDLSAKDGAARIPRDAKVTSPPPTSAWDIFDKDEGSWTWGDLEDEAVKNEDQRWIRELAEAMLRAKERKQVPTVQAIFRSRTSPRSYRPILYRCDWRSNGSLVFKVLFVEDVGLQLEMFPEHLQVLASSLVMASRFRYEVLEPCFQWIEDAPDVGEAIIRDRIRVAIENIEQESASRGLMESVRLVRAFTTSESKERVRQLFDEWYAIRESLDKALEGGKLDDLVPLLTKLKEMNREYLSMATKRYHEIVSE